MIIYCSNALKKSLKLNKSQIEDSGLTNEDDLFCWHGHIKKIEGKNTIVLTNDKTLYSIIFRNKLPRNPEKFKKLVQESIAEFFKSERYKDEDIENYLEKMGDIIFSEKSNRSITGHMNNIFSESSYAGEWIEITPQLTQTSWINGLIRRVGKDYITPSKEMKDGLKSLINSNFDESKIEKCYVISVKLKTGCYRHIKVPVDLTLEEFADAILWAFDFMNDHAHALFMDNIGWSSKDCYYAEYVDEEGEYRHTSDYTLEVVEVGQKFLFIFDFGSEWRFQCKVLKELEDKSSDEIEIMRSHGKSPDQYPDYY